MVGFIVYLLPLCSILILVIYGCLFRAEETAKHFKGNGWYNDYIMHNTPYGPIFIRIFGAIWVVILLTLIIESCYQYYLHR